MQQIICYERSAYVFFHNLAVIFCKVSFHDWDYIVIEIKD